MYTAALTGDISDRAHILTCKSGIARTAIRHGDINQYVLTSFFILVAMLSIRDEVNL